MISAEVRTQKFMIVKALSLKQRTGMWAGTVGTQRLLKLFDKYNIKATWFIPGSYLSTYPSLSHSKH